MTKLAFIILHYNSIEDTIECVKSIHEKCVGYNYQIYIIDNASPNGSGKIISEKYKDDSQITTIQSTNNLGFAKGNNLAIEQALKDGYDDFVVVLNNDTKIIQNNFCELIKEQYEKSNFAVLGPTIFTPIGKTTINPGRSHILQGKELNEFEKFYSQGLHLIQKGHILGLKFLQKKMSLKQRLRHPFKPKPKYTENCVLHGCCLIFSKKYFEKFKGFDDRTFLYFEEEILYAHVIHSGLKTVYAPEIEIWHKEDGATDSIFGNNLKKTAFIYENILKSISIYKELLKNND